jgi:hypothetical protein
MRSDHIFILTLFAASSKHSNAIPHTTSQENKIPTGPHPSRTATDLHLMQINDDTSERAA